MTEAPTRTLWPLAAAAALLLAAVSFGAQAGPQDELKDIRSRIEALRKQLTESESSKAEAGDALKDSERAVSETSRKLYQISGQRREVNTSLSRLQSKIHGVEDNIAAEQGTLGRLLYQQYVGGQSDAIKLVLNGEDPNEIARQFHYLSYVSRARAELLASLRENLAELEKLTGETRRKSSELHALQSEETSQMRRLERVGQRATGQLQPQAAALAAVTQHDLSTAAHRAAAAERLGRIALQSGGTAPQFALANR